MKISKKETNETNKESENDKNINRKWFSKSYLIDYVIIVLGWVTPGVLNFASVEPRKRYVPPNRPAFQVTTNQNQNNTPHFNFFFIINKVSKYEKHW